MTGATARSSKRVALAAAALIVTVASAATPALASPARAHSDVLTATSSNWAGYAVAAPDGAPAASFSNVSGSWIQPAATCTAGTPAFSAFWVGIGGFSPTSQALDQVGTEADCSPTGHPTYFAWYELACGAGQSEIAAEAGDGSGERRRLGKERLDPHHKRDAEEEHVREATHDDVAGSRPSSAEWVAEAPSAC